MTGRSWHPIRHPDHHVQEGERFIASIYNAIRRNQQLWLKTAC